MDFGVADNDLLFPTKDTKEHFFGKRCNILSILDIFAVFQWFFSLLIDRIQTYVGRHVPRIDLGDRDLEIPQLDSQRVEKAS